MSRQCVQASVFFADLTPQVDGALSQKILDWEMGGGKLRLGSEAATVERGVCPNCKAVLSYREGLGWYCRTVGCKLQFEHKVKETWCAWLFALLRK